MYGGQIIWKILAAGIVASGLDLHGPDLWIEGLGFLFQLRRHRSVKAWLAINQEGRGRDAGQIGLPRLGLKQHRIIDAPRLAQ